MIGDGFLFDPVLPSLGLWFANHKDLQKYFFGSGEHFLMTLSQLCDLSVGLSVASGRLVRVKPGLSHER